MINFLDHWQTLAGSIIGPFLAVIVSVWIENWKDRKEFLRKIEISVTKSLNDIYIVQEQLLWFSQRVKILMDEIKNDSSNRFFLVRINFPSMREIYRDAETLDFKIKSYYLHNKLLWTDTAIKDINNVVSQFKNDFEDILKQNELLVGLIRMNPSPNPVEQRTMYLENLKNFDGVIVGYSNKPISQCIQLMTQVKVYNNHLRGKTGFWFRWRYEGKSLKFFYTNDEYKKFSGNLKSLDLIDKKIESEVRKSIEDAQKRSIELRQKH